MTPFSDPIQEAAYQLEYRQVNRERLTENAKIWRQKNAESLKEKKRQDYLKNKDAYKARAKASQERRAEEIKAFRSTPEYKEKKNTRRRAQYLALHGPPKVIIPKTHEEILEDKRQYYLENKEAHRTRMKAYYEANKELWQEYQKSREYWKRKFYGGLCKARWKLAEIIDFESLKEFYHQVFTKESDTCTYCRGTFPIRSITIDHKQPFKLGGKHEVSNLAVSCLLCNLKKGVTPFEQWLAL